MINLTINGKTCAAQEGESVLTVARREGIDIPAFCHDETLAPYGACRLCLVEVVKGDRKETVTSCTLQAVEGMEVVTDTPEIIHLRKVLIELYLAQAPKAESVQKMAERYDIKKTRFAKKIIRDDPLQNRCILCGLCVRVCREVIGPSAINYIGRGQFTEINTPFYEENEVCLGCGACAKVCPTQAILYEDVEKTRVMRSWSETRVPLKQCTVCGRYYAPEVFTSYAYEKLEPKLKASLKDVCPDCRRKEMTRQAIRLSIGEPVAG